MRFGDRLLRAVTVALVFGLGAFGFAFPLNILFGGVAWLAFLFPMFAGWGWIAIRATRAGDVDFGLRTICGVAAVLAICGVLLALGHCTRSVILGISAIGAAGFAWRELVTPAPAWHALRDAGRFARANPAVATLYLVVVLCVLGSMIGGVAMTDRNAWDDDVAYTPLVKRILDRGDLIEPFAFRRIASYGGQSMLHAFAAARGTLANINTIDKAFAEGLGLLLVVGHARERRANPLWTTLTVLLLLWAPHTMLNTASYFTGFAIFMGLYRFVVKERWIVVGLVAAAACTLRMNYLPVVALFILLALWFKLRSSARGRTLKAAWAEHKRPLILVLIAGTIALVPWMVATVQSNHTFLFPILRGTYNAAIPLVPETSTWTDELGLLVWSSTGPVPILIVPLLFVALAFVKDERPLRPLIALWLASLVGFLLLVHSFLSSDPMNLWRYAFGYCAALTCITCVELSGTEDTGDVRLPTIGRYTILAALIMQLVITRDAVPNLYMSNMNDVKEAFSMSAGDPQGAREERRYHAMQQAIPEGASFVAMLDDPWHLDYARNSIANLDSPGFASPGNPGLPCFTSPAAYHRYFKQQGYQYLAFVRAKRSRYFYRRQDWVHRVFADAEIFELMSAYSLDAIDNFASLATTLPVVYDREGLVVLDLRGDPGPVAPYDPDELVRREAWLRAFAEREHLHAAWTLSDRQNVRFHDGFENVEYVDAKGEIVTRGNDLDGRPSRGMQRRTHIRVRGDKRDVHFEITGGVAPERTLTDPRLDVSIDGNLIGDAVVDFFGNYSVQGTVPGSMLADGKWHDVYLLWSSMGFAERETHQLFTARLDTFEWEPQ